MEFAAPEAGLVYFNAPTGLFQVDTASQFTGTVQNFSGQDGLDFADIIYGANTTVGYTANSSNTGGTLTVSDGRNTANLTLLGDYTPASFSLANDGRGGTLVTDPPLTSSGSQTLLTQHS